MRDIKTILQVLFVLLFIGTDEVGAQNKSEQTPGWLLQGIITDVHGEPLVGRLCESYVLPKVRFPILTESFPCRFIKGRHCFSIMSG